MSASDLVVEAADGVRLTVTVHGDGQGSRTPVLLLHGLSQQRHFWTPVLNRMRTRPVAALDQRGHGDTDTPLSTDYSIDACAGDVLSVLDLLDWPGAVVVGHSWGASVALCAAARFPDRVRAAALVDGGLWTPAALGPRDEVRRRLTPPALGIPAEELWALIRSGELGHGWSQERQDALAPTFVADEQGRLRTRIGIERHMAVLEGLLDADPEIDLAGCEEHATPVWVALCQPRGAAQQPDAAASARARTNVLVHTWAGAIHDVPLQWPSLVAGFIDSLVDELDGDPA